nr:hypothetical protein Iba_chr04aCG14480 [Ipomoea batatas]GMC84525.1 hypothetical protein Iba_chr04cCG12450 [Ipomoea batatas]GMC86496.1 hypothetical protein Iba_chr04dCG11470 [Ipomoea batatas]GMC89221.1 hypothetical protein Iba_chr04eCG17420 [Ipomoea batatas]
MISSRKILTSFSKLQVSRRHLGLEMLVWKLTFSFQIGQKMFSYLHCRRMTSQRQNVRICVKE